MKFEKLNLDKFKQDEVSDISKLFGGAATGKTPVICTKQSDDSDTGHPDPPEDDPDTSLMTQYVTLSE